VKRLEFNTYEDFADTFCNTFETTESVSPQVSVIAPYKELKEIFKEIVAYGYDIADILLEMPETSNYDSEYILSLFEDGIWIERFKRENGYFRDYSDATFVFDKCVSTVISYCRGAKVFEIGIIESNESNECNCDSDCESCNYNMSAGSEEHTEKVTASTSKEFFIDGESVTEEMYKEKFKEFEDLYLNNITDILLKYSAIQDEMDEWRKLLHW
jgi:hypothetical protein